MTSSDTPPESSQELDLPEEIRQLFREAFDASQLEPGAINGTPQDFEDALQRALPRLVLQHQQAVAHARDLFLREDTDGSARTVFARMDELTASGELFDSEDLCPDDAFAVLLDRAASADESDQLEDAAAMYTLLQVLRPDQPMPYINGFNVIWRTAGVRAAAECYALTAPVMIDPIYFYYAADCFEHAGLMDDARRAIACSLEALEDEELGFDVDDALAAEIRSYHQTLCGATGDETWVPPDARA